MLRLSRSRQAILLVFRLAEIGVADTDTIHYFEVAQISGSQCPDVSKFVVHEVFDSRNWVARQKRDQIRISQAVPPMKRRKKGKL